LIDFFVHVDPERQKQYQNQPADEEQRSTLLQLVKRLPSSEREDYPATDELTKGEAAELIDEINDRLTDLQSEEDDEEIELLFLDNHFNEEDLREDFGYKKLTRKQLKELGQYLKTHHPGWESKSRYDTAEIVLKLFPEQKKAGRSRAHSSRKITQSSKGCLVVIIPLVGILVPVLVEAIAHI
jgi:hypothetical protein